MEWLNTLYLDKVIKYQNIIQAFSCTNRLFGPDKPHGIIRYYRYPHTMEQHINDTVKLYSSDKPIGLFVYKLASNLEAMSELAADITEFFAHAGVDNFEKLPDDLEACAKFAKLFNTFNQHLEATRVQGFQWSKLSYEVAEQSAEYAVEALVNHEVARESTNKPIWYWFCVIKSLPAKVLAQVAGDVPFDISGYFTEIDTGKIDVDYMNSRFDKYLKELNQHKDQASIELTLNELHKSFSSLTQAEQKYAKLFCMTCSAAMRS